MASVKAILILALLAGVVLMKSTEVESVALAADPRAARVAVEVAPEDREEDAYSTVEALAPEMEEQVDVQAADLQWVVLGH